MVTPVSSPTITRLYDFTPTPIDAFGISYPMALFGSLTFFHGKKINLGVQLGLIRGYCFYSVRSCMPVRI